MSKSLVAFDTDQIKSYVFGTSTLKEIRGASALLDRLNREDMVRLAGGEENKIYANGGGGLFLVETAKAKSVIEAVEQVYRENWASVTGVSVELPEGEVIQEQLKLIRYRLRLAKDQSSAKLYPLTHPLLRFCDSCGSRYAQIAKQGQMLCESCYGKREEDEQVKDQIWEWATAPLNASRNRLWGRLIIELWRHNVRLLGLPRPEDFNEIGKLSTPKGYMGLIYADGDGMGKEIETITSREKMRQFAEAVDDSIYQATGEAIGKYLEPDRGELWPFDVLLLGGDDVVMVTRAESAIEVALHLVKRFPVLTGRRLGRDKALSLSACVVISHVKYPIGSLLDLAQSGLKFAKQQGARRRLNGETLEGGLLNFLVVSSADHLDFKEHYKHTLKQEDKDSILYRTQRPYTASEMDKLLGQIRMLREKGVPHGKLEQLRAALFKTRKQGILDAMLAILRLHNPMHINALLELVGHESKQKLYLPWMEKGHDWVSPILDITELFDFVR